MRIVSINRLLTLVLLVLAVIDEETLGDVYDRICDVIEREQSLDHVWVPSKDKI